MYVNGRRIIQKVNIHAAQMEHKIVSILMIMEEKKEIKKIEREQIKTISERSIPWPPTHSMYESHSADDFILFLHSFHLLTEEK
jgi:hypothetical protein